MSSFGGNSTNCNAVLDKKLILLICSFSFICACIFWVISRLKREKPVSLP